MPLYAVLFIAFLTANTVTTAFLLVRMWNLRREPGALSLMWGILCLAIWSFTYLLEIASQDVNQKMFWLKMEYLGIPFIAPALFLFGLIYSGYDRWLTTGRIVLLNVIPGLACVLATTNEFHNLIWMQIVPPTNSPFGPLVVAHGPFFIVYAAYSYILLLLTALFFVQILIRRRGIYRLQATLMLIGLAVPWLGNIIYLLHLTPIPGYDWTPLAFTLTVMALEVGFTQYRLASVLPVAQITIFNAMLDAMLVVNSQGQIVDANAACNRVFGVDETSLIGQDVRTIFPEWNAWIQSTEPKSETSREIRLPNDPERRIFNLRLEAISNRRGLTTAYLAIFNDVTRAVNAQSQMRLLVAALEAAQNGVMITDPNGMVQWVNPAFTTLTGYERNEIIGRTPRLLKSGRQSTEFYQNMWSTILSGRVWRGELVNRRKDGSLYDEEMTITPLIREDGTITNFIAVQQDITERKKAEEELRLAHQEAVEASRLKTQLLASVSHDLRTPLGTIMGYAEMLLLQAFGEQSEAQQSATVEILHSANALLTFVNNLIGQAQIETGKIMLNEQPFEPSILVESIRSIVDYHIKKKNLDFEIEIDPALPPLVMGDSYWLRQIVLNLVNNAVKFTDQGKIRVRLYKSNDSCWAIEVKDTGIGIPEEYREIVFDVFRQQDHTTGRKYGGSGLGLFIVKQLALLMGGRVELESTVGEGSTFTVFVPLRTAEEAE